MPMTYQNKTVIFQFQRSKKKEKKPRNDRQCVQTISNNHTYWWIYLSTHIRSRARKNPVPKIWKCGSKNPFGRCVCIRDYPLFSRARAGKVRLINGKRNNEFNASTLQRVDKQRNQKQSFNPRIESLSRHAKLPGLFVYYYYYYYHRRRYYRYHCYHYYH